MPCPSGRAGSSPASGTMVDWYPPLGEKNNGNASLVIVLALPIN